MIVYVLAYHANRYASAGEVMGVYATMASAEAEQERLATTPGSAFAGGWSVEEFELEGVRDEQQ